MGNNSRSISGSSLKSIKDRFQAKPLQDDLKKGFKNLSDKTRSIFQGKAGTPRPAAKDYSVGERQLDPYGYEKINIADDGSDIFIFKRPDRLSFDDMDVVPVSAAGGYVGILDPKPAEVEVPSAASDDFFNEDSLDEILSGKSSKMSIEISSGVVDDNGNISKVDHNNILNKIKGGYTDENKVSSIHRVEFMDDVDEPEPVEEAPVQAEAVEPVVEDVIPAEEMLSVDDTIEECAVPQAEESVPAVEEIVMDDTGSFEAEAPVEEMSVEDADVQESEDIDVTADDFYSLIEADDESAEDMVEADLADDIEEVVEEDVEEAVAEDVEEVMRIAPDEPVEVVAEAEAESSDVADSADVSDVTGVVSAGLKSFEVPESDVITGLMMDGTKSSSVSEASVDTVVKEEVQVTETGASEVVQPVRHPNLTEDGEGRRTLTDPKVRRPTRTMRFKNGVLQNVEPQEELRRPLE